MVVEKGRRGGLYILPPRLGVLEGIFRGYCAFIRHYLRVMRAGADFIYKDYILESMAFTGSSLAALRAGR